MFTAAEFWLIRENCLPAFEKLLTALEIPLPDWKGEEFQIYDKLDDQLEEKICAMLKSESVIEGYYALLNLGGVAYDYDEAPNLLLERIISNAKKILDGSTEIFTVAQLQKILAVLRRLNEVVKSLN